MYERACMLVILTGICLINGCSQPPEPKVHVDLNEAVSRGLVTVGGSGAGLDTIQIRITSTSDEPQRVTIRPGTVFKALSIGPRGFPQNMVVRSEEVVTLLYRGHSNSMRIRAACANMNRETPKASDKYTIGDSDASGDLQKLLKLSGFSSESFAVQQFAIWVITDNPPRGRFTGFTGAEKGPTATDRNRIRKLLEKAGIPLQKYQSCLPTNANDDDAD